MYRSPVNLDISGSLTQIFLIAGILSITACSHLPDSRHISAAALTAAKDPFTWVPVAGAVVVLAADENHLARSASRDTEVFGSRTQADKASGHLNLALNVAAMASSLLVPEPSSREVFKDAVALTAAAGTTIAIKHSVDRQRPDDSDHHSFPSGHASQSFAAARVLRDNLHQHPLDKAAGQWVDAGIYTMATATGWARIEAGEHYPTDVFMGAALGNFIVVWVQTAFELKEQQALEASVQIDPFTSVPVINLALTFQ